MSDSLVFTDNDILASFSIQFAVIVMPMTNLPARIAGFSRKRSSSLAPSIFKEDLNNSTSFANLTMANMLVQQPRAHRSSTITIHRSTASKETALQMSQSVDDQVFLYGHGSTSLLRNFLTRFSSESQISISSSQSPHLTTTTDFFALSLSSISNKCSQIEFDDINHLTCDPPIHPMSDSTTEDKTRDQITSSTSNHDEFINQLVHEDILLDTNATIQQSTDISDERPVRRRKRRSSLTRNSFSLDDTPISVQTTEKSDPDHQQTPTDTTNEHSEFNLSTQPNDETEITTLSNEIMENTHDKPDVLIPYRPRRLRHRHYRHERSTPEIISPIPVKFYLPDEGLNTETPLSPSRDSLSSLPISPVLSPTTPKTANIQNGALKRFNSVGTTKKMVHFADSIGRELTQIQYIQPSQPEYSKELSFLLGSSFLSSSPPSYSKSQLYLPPQSHFEHKPWSFDVALPLKQFPADKRLPRKFSCLFRQPNVEHPDIYLHEIWKCQVKLEHADIPLHQSTTGEQYLIGSAWVSNAGYSKYVSIKYTFNRWLNTYEHEIQHCRHSNDFRNLDQYKFHIDIPVDVDRIDFVLRYCVNGQEYWDNNDGNNYTLQAEAAYTPQTTISVPRDCDFNEMRFY